MSATASGMYQEAKMAAARQYEGAQNKPDKQDGTFTQRIRSLAGSAEEQEYRLRNILRSLRAPPPELNGISGIGAVHTTVEEHLQRHENAHGNINNLISELEGLLA